MPPVGGPSPEVGKILLHFPLPLQKSDSAASIPTPKSRSLSAALPRGGGEEGVRERVSGDKVTSVDTPQIEAKGAFCPNLYVISGLSRGPRIKNEK